MPISERKLAANRANAQKSTGPRTTEGKCRSRRNSLRHGAAAIGILSPLRGEQEFDLYAIRSALMEQYQPDNIQETQLVELMTSAYVRLQRSEEMSAALLDGTMQAIQINAGRKVGLTVDEPMGCAAALGDEKAARIWQTIERYRTRATIDYHRAVEQLNRLQQARRDEPVREIERQQKLDKYHRDTHADIRPIPAPTQPSSVGSFGKAAELITLPVSDSRKMRPTPSARAPKHRPAPNRTRPTPSQ